MLCFVEPKYIHICAKFYSIDDTEGSTQAEEGI